jgi:hypothetical protein
MNACTECGTAIGPRTKSGLCSEHARGKGHGAHPKPWSCSVCSTAITKNKTGMCKPCGLRVRNVSAQHRRAVSEGQRRAMQDPEFYAKKCRIAARNAQKSYLDPERLAVARIIALAHLEKAFTPEALKLKAERIRAARDAMVDKRLSWCPPEYRALHHRNVNSKRMHAADSRAMIEQLMADNAALKHIDSALDFLKRLAPVAKLENGYRYGNAILRPSEVVERAKLRGWQPERWAA